MTGPQVFSGRPRSVLLRGREPSPRRRVVQAGLLHARLDGPNLSEVALGGLRLVDRIYVAVRDDTFNVVPATVTPISADIGVDRFRVEFQGRNCHGSIDFQWRGLIEGHPDNTISYSLEGEARTAFRYNKIGLIVLHPVRSHEARTFVAETDEGIGTTSRFPLSVGPQSFLDGSLRGLLPPYATLRIDLGYGAPLELRFSGDEFELEDERNWTEFGYKSYSGPLSRPWPIDARPGDSIKQSVVLSYHGGRPPAARPSSAVRLSRHANQKLPSIGFGVASHGEPLTVVESERLRRLHPASILADLHLGTPEFDDQWARASETTNALQAELMGALYFGSRPAYEVARLADSYGRQPVRIGSLLVFEEAGYSSLRNGTPTELIRAVSPALRELFPGVVLAVGSDRYLSEVIREPPDIAGADAVSFGVSPSGHADEDWAIVGNLPAQGDAVRTLQSYLPGTPVIVSPVTLQVRFGSWPRPPAGTGHLPPQVDLRQMSLLGAVWTLGSIAELSAAGAWKAIFYETTGWRGVMEQDHGSPLPGQFPSRPGEVFPMYYVFADLADLRDSPMLRTSHPQGVCAMAFSKPVGPTALIANLSPRGREVRVGPFPGAVVSVRMLDISSAETAMRDPETWIDHRQRASLSAGELVLSLGPYAYARVDTNI